MWVGDVGRCCRAAESAGSAVAASSSGERVPARSWRTRSEYARACGGSVASSHARYGRADERIAPAMTDALKTEIVDFALAADAEVTADHARYKALRAAGEI